MDSHHSTLVGPHHGVIRPHEAKLDFLSRTADACWIAVGLRIACLLYSDAWVGRHGTAAAVAVVVFYLVGQARGLYRPWRAEPLTREFGQVWLAWAFVVPLLLLLGFATKTSEDYSRVVILSWFAIAPTLISVWRVV